MSLDNINLLSDRGVVSVSGPDAKKLLQGVITNDMDRLETEPAIYAGLLSPQGKVQFDFLVVNAKKPPAISEDREYLIDISSTRADELAKRLVLYRLRARAEIRVISSSHHVLTSWLGQEEPCGPTGMLPRVVYRDPRHAELGWRGVLGPVRDHDLTEAPDTGGVGEMRSYHAHRIALGVPEGGKDYDFGDAFLHEANIDLCHGVSFEKGCYVGQEIVSRMEHRGTVRKRIVRVQGSGELPGDRPDVVMGEVVIGRLGSVAGRQGLALLRLDRAIEAIDKGRAITAAGITLEVDAAMIALQRQLMAEKAGGAA